MKAMASIAIYSVNDTKYFLIPLKRDSSVEDYFIIMVIILSILIFRAFLVLLPFRIISTIILFSCFPSIVLFGFVFVFKLINYWLTHCGRKFPYMSKLEKKKRYINSKKAFRKKKERGDVKTFLRGTFICRREIYNVQIQVKKCDWSPIRGKNSP